MKFMGYKKSGHEEMFNLIFTSDLREALNNYELNAEFIRSMLKQKLEAAIDLRGKSYCD